MSCVGLSQGRSQVGKKHWVFKSMFATRPVAISDWKENTTNKKQIKNYFMDRKKKTN